MPFGKIAYSRLKRTFGLFRALAFQWQNSARDQVNILRYWRLGQTWRSHFRWERDGDLADKA